jgi:hypothetical protein
MSDDRWIRDALTEAESPRPGFQSDLRARLTDAWHDRDVVAPTEFARPRGRRSWWIGASAAAVLTALVGGLAWVADRDDSRVTAPIDAAPTTPQSTTPPSSTASPTTAADTTPSTTPPGSSAAGTGLVAWVAAQAAAGRTELSIEPGEATSASLLSARGADPEHYTATVLLADGSMADFPFPVTSRTLASELLGLGERVAVLRRDGGPLALWALDPQARTWSEAPPLGLGEHTANWVEAVALDGSVLVPTTTRVRRESDGFYEVTAARGARVGTDLTVSPIAEPPPGIPMSWTSVAGGKALLMGLDTNAGMEDPLRSPWAYDLASDTWKEVSDPEWLVCPAPDCTWSQPHEYGDAWIELMTPHGLVLTLPDSSIGVLDPVSLTWRRLDDPPFASTPPYESLTYRSQYLAGNRWIVSVPYGIPPGDRASPTVGVLDVVEGTWRTFELWEGEAAIGWVQKRTARALVLAPDPRATTALPSLAIDVTTGEPRIATDDDLAAARSLLAGSFTADELLAILGDQLHAPSGSLPAADDTDMLAGWPEPPATDPGRLTDVPYLVPSADLVGLPTALQPSPATIRTEFAEPSGVWNTEYVQVWFDADDPSITVDVRTVPGRPDATAPEFREPADVAGWQEAFFVDSSGGHVILSVADHSGHVRVHSQGLGRDATLAIAKSLRRRGGGVAGWDSTSTLASMVILAESWNSPPAQRTLRWYTGDSLVAELHVGSPATLQVQTAQASGDTRQMVELNGTLGVLTEVPGRAVVAWAVAPGVTAVFGLTDLSVEGSLREATLAAVRAMKSVDRATWEGYARPDPSTSDGCNSLFC